MTSGVSWRENKMSLTQSWAPRCLLGIVLATVTAAAAGAATYYVSPRGDDSNAGTESEPWRTIARVNRAPLAAGDRVFFEGGQTFEGNLILDERLKADPARPLVIGSYGDGRAVIRAGRGTAILARNIGGVAIRDLELEGGDAGANRGFGVEVVNERGAARLDSVWLDNLDVSGFHWAGIYVGGAPGLPGTGGAPQGRFGYRNVKIERSVAHGNMYYGIWVSGPWAGWKARPAGYANENVTISDSVAHDNPGDPAYKDNHSGNGILLDDTDGGLVDHCTAWHNGAANGSQQGGPVGIWADESNGVVIQFCESYGNRTGGAADGGGFDLDGGVTHSVMQYNYSHDNDGAGYLVWSYWGAVHPLAGNVIRYNISANDGRKHRYAGVHIGTSGGAVQDIEVYNNTVYMPAGAARPQAAGVAAKTAQPRAVWVGGSEPLTGIRFSNNLLISEAGVPLVEVEPHQKDVTFLGNAYWVRGGKFIALDRGATYDSLEGWRAATGRERWQGKATGIFADPEVSSGVASESMAGKRALSTLAAFRLLPGSPLIDAGLDLEAAFGLDVGPRDFWGTPLPQSKGFDVGACEAAAPAK